MHASFYILKYGIKERVYVLYIAGKPTDPERAQKKLNFFISYTHKDNTNNFASRLCDDLKRHGWDVFLDTGSIVIGGALPQHIAEGIDNCDGMIIIYTKNYCTSAWCPKELDYAVERKKQLFPLKRQDVDYDHGSSVAWHLSSLLYCKFLEDEKYEESLEILINSIKKVRPYLCYLFVCIFLYFLV